MRRPIPIKPAPGQESVWAYPRPPALELSSRHLRVVFAGQTIAETRRGYRVLETSHPPVYYFPPEDIDRSALRPVAGQTGCEWKGTARYYDVAVGERGATRVAWSYPEPDDRFEPIKDYLAFYAARVDACFVDGQVVVPQPGDFYGGWITPDVVGPFKGGPGTWGW